MANIYKSDSCLTSILSCKLYQASTRKDKIRAALENPINAELLKQLDEYLNDEYRPKKADEAEPENNDYDSSDEWDFDNVDSDPDSFSAPTSQGGPRLSEKYGDELDAEGVAKSEATQVSEESTDSDDTDDTTTADSSTAVRKMPISADTVITAPFVENHVSLAGLSGEIKGTLNARASTQGVVRTSVKNDELWVYYSDSTNLNNVMSAVIDLLSAANYQFLIFNRLARTDNAIVFTINSNDTMNAMESEKHEE